MSLEILARLELARKDLLDLGFRNPLLNHRKKSKQVRVVDELATEVFRLLVAEEQSMSFEALPDEKIAHVVALEDEAQDTANVDWGGLLDQPDNSTGDSGLAKRHKDKKLQTAMSSEKLQTRLLSIHRDARTYIEEQSVNVLFLAVGFVHWYETPSSEESRRAPLILIPVELVRQSAQDRFHVVWTAEDIDDTHSLAAKFRNDFNVTLPEMGNAEDLDVAAYFNAIASSFGGHSRWKVEANEIVLGFFSFGKFLLYRDLNPESWPEKNGPDTHPILSKLLGDGFRESESLFGDEDHLDEHVLPVDLHQVSDADSSQTLAILDINSGRNLVLQGPPGTGKSQTITNIIAEAIGNNRKVLFVSEKMAALEVVKRRLDLVGLGDAVLELHSHKTNKKQLLEELHRTLQQGRPTTTDGEDDLMTLTRLRDQLNAYCIAVNLPVGQTKMPFVRALGHCNHFSSEPSLPLPSMPDWTEADYREVRSLVQRLDQLLAETGPPCKNPFYPNSIQEFLPSQRQVLEQSLQEAGERTEAVIRAAHELAEAMGLPHPEDQKTVERLCQSARRAADAPALQGVSLDSDAWRSRGEDLERLFAAGRHLQTSHKRFDKWFIEQAWSQDLLDIRQVYLTHGNKWWRFLSGRYRRAQVRLQGLCRRPLPQDPKKALTLIDAVLARQKSLQIYEELTLLGQELFSSQ